MARRDSEENMSTAEKKAETAPETKPQAEEAVSDDEMESLIDDVTHDDRPDNVRRLLPVHDAPFTGKHTLVVERKKRGRPRNVERMPTTSDLEYHQEMSEEKQRFIEKDPVVRAAAGKLDSSEILHLIKSQVAKEAAALEFQRIENEKYGKDTAQISTRRIDALTKIANIELEIKKIGGDILDLKGEKFQRVFALLIDSFREVASNVLSEEQVDLLFNRLGTALEGWEERAAIAITGKDSGK